MVHNAYHVLRTRKKAQDIEAILLQARHVCRGNGIYKAEYGQRARGLNRDGRQTDEDIERVWMLMEMKKEKTKQHTTQLIGIRLDHGELRML